MFVVATAGHVDHGKSTLVRALTGMEPDRWAEERRRGLTIDLGFAWTTLPSGRDVAFVDVPGHENFLANMLAGLGPVPAVCFVVAADEGWRAQSNDHRDAVAALGIRHGLIVVSRADRAPDRVGEVTEQARAELAGTGLADAPAVAVSATTGMGLDDVRTTLDSVLAGLPAPIETGRVRLWVDRAFSITGAGTVVTGTLTAGSLARGDHLQLLGRTTARAVTVRGLQSRGIPRETVRPVDRVAVNLRGITADQVHRGDVLVTPDAWPATRIADIRRIGGIEFTARPDRLIAHIGTAAAPIRLRAFDDDHARLTLDRALPIVVGDRLVLRDPGAGRPLGGAVVLDADPPPLRRRGAGARRAGTLATMNPAGDARAEVARRGLVTEQQLRRLGLLPETGGTVPDGVVVLDDWWVHESAYAGWRQRLTTALRDLHEQDPLSPGLSRGAARDLLGMPVDRVLTALARDAGLETAGGYLRIPGAGDDLGPAEPALARLEARLRAAPFRAPEAADLAELCLATPELAAAERAGRLLRLAGGVVLLPSAPALAMRELARLAQPFTTSQARQALDTTRRVAIPLLENLDARGWTRRIDAGHREVAR